MVVLGKIRAVTPMSHLNLQSAVGKITPPILSSKFLASLLSQRCCTIKPIYIPIACSCFPFMAQSEGCARKTCAGHQVLQFDLPYLNKDRRNVVAEHAFIVLPMFSGLSIQLSYGHFSSIRNHFFCHSLHHKIAG